ncbi:hypothetical protein FB45DRAFT_1084073 [Roridomyces roridus]|uniref:Uncharacterized protein n=1 Tax=Roridomyces roridus TaxID=1738132 RepID=A0AAD7FKT3_9AGAR|nr:hypothetical protein FB45DRAFT_1084073 [Roridomyces roridus]
MCVTATCIVRGDANGLAGSDLEGEAKLLDHRAEAEVAMCGFIMMSAALKLMHQEENGSNPPSTGGACSGWRPWCLRNNHTASGSRQRRRFQRGVRYDGCEMVDKAHHGPPEYEPTVSRCQGQAQAGPIYKLKKVSGNDVHTQSQRALRTSMPGPLYRNESGYASGLDCANALSGGTFGKILVSGSRVKSWFTQAIFISYSCRAFAELPAFLRLQPKSATD